MGSGKGGSSATPQYSFEYKGTNKSETPTANAAVDPRTEGGDVNNEGMFTGNDNFAIPNSTSGNFGPHKSGYDYPTDYGGFTADLSDIGWASARGALMGGPIGAVTSAGIEFGRQAFERGLEIEGFTDAASAMRGQQTMEAAQGYGSLLDGDDDDDNNSLGSSGDDGDFGGYGHGL